MKIGFTGTRGGMTPEQKASVAVIFADYPKFELHHGACVGSDHDAVLMASMNRDNEIVAHPGMGAKATLEENQKLLSQSAVDLSTKVVGTKTYFARNRDIVDETEILIACPPCEPMPENGGTAYTVNYAKKRGKTVLIVWPTGFIE